MGSGKTSSSGELADDKSALMRNDPGKKAREYTQSRQPDGQPAPTVSGLDCEESHRRRLEQQQQTLEASFIEKGLVPVAVDFANTARFCGIPYKKSGHIPTSFWIPAWYLGAWYNYRYIRGLVPFEEHANVPTKEFQQFILDIQLDHRELYLLVAELVMSYPHLIRYGVDIEQGLCSWLKLHEHW